MGKNFEFDRHYGLDHDKESSGLDTDIEEYEIQHIAEVVCRRAMFLWYNEGRNLDISSGIVACSRKGWHAAWNVNEKWSFSRRHFDHPDDANQYERHITNVITNTLTRTIGTRVQSINLN